METEPKEYKPKTSLTALVEASLVIEKLRVASQVRQTHLELQNRTDPETDELLKEVGDLEKYVDGRVAKLISSHPAYGWFSRVKGVGKENIGKVVAQIDIERATTISALWKYCGYAVTDGKAPKREKGGGKLEYNSQLRSMCWRLGGSLMKANGKFYDYYKVEKEKYVQRFINQGVKIVPAASIPKRNGKRNDGDGYISEGHLHNMALRKMIKLFLSCLWLEWREAVNLPVTEPYAIGQLKHDSFIKPEEMVDR